MASPSTLSPLESMLRHVQSLQQTEDAAGSTDARIDNKAGALTFSRLKSHLRKLDHDLHLLDEISRLASEHRATMERRRAKVHNSLQPLLCLPLEVLSSIFELAALRRDDPIRHHSNFSLPPHIHSSQSFYALSSLCRHMWQVAVSTPRCWRNVNVFTTSTIKSTPSTVLESRLRRSGNYTFNLTIYVDSDFANTFTIDDALSGLHPHVSRCRSMKVCSGDKTIDFSRVTSLIKDHALELPALRAVSIIDSTVTPFVEASVIDPRPGFVPFWNEATPQIESAEIKFGRPDTMAQMPVLASVALPWGALKRLRVDHGFNGELVAEMLKSCPQLEHFFWRGVPDDDRENIEEPIALPDVKSITLGEWTTGLVRFIAPNCEKLCMHEEIYTMDVGRFLADHSDEQDFPTVKRLSFSHDEGFGDEVKSFLSSHPFLEEIFVSMPISVESGAQQRCELFDGLALPAIDSSAPNTPFLPTFRVFYYQTSMDDWYDQKGSPTGEARAQAESLRRLLRRRPSLSIKLMFDQLRTTKLPQAVDSLMEEFGPRLVTVDYYAVPEWAEEWHACDEF